MKEAGFNAVRSAHHPMSPEMLYACDKYGLVVMDEVSKSITLKPLRALPGRFLMKDDMTSVVYNKKSGQIDVRLRIDLNATPNAEKALIARMQAVNVCLHTNAPFLKRHKN